MTRKPTDVCFLEFKHKVGEHRFKRRIKLPNNFHGLPLESSEFHAVLDQLRMHEGKVLEHIFPSYIVSYTRKRFCIPEFARPSAASSRSSRRSQS